MISDLRPYPTYQESGNTWLGPIPSHWKVRKLKYLTRFINGLPFKPGDWRESGTPIIRIQNLNGSKNFNYTTRRSLPKDLLIQPGDLLFSWSGNRGTSFGPFIWKHPFSGYLNQHIFKLVSYRLDTDYFAYMLRAVTVYIEQEKTHGIIGLVHVTKPELGSVNVPVAGEDEQKNIVRFLDWSNRRLESAIRAKRKVLALLNEQKQAIIHTAVTRGIRPEAPTSSQEWPFLPQLPAHWSVHRAKWLFKQVALPIPDGAEMVTCFRDGQVTLRANRRTTGFTNAIWELGYQGIKPGQLVLHSMDAFAGAIGVSDSTGKCSPEYVICEPAMAEIDSQYYAYLLRDLALRRLFVTLCPSVRERAPRVRFSDFALFVLPKPPLSEQKEIVSYIATACRAIDSSLSVLKAEINLLREYGVRLVADVITGKLDVRQASATVPDDYQAGADLLEGDPLRAVDFVEDFAEEALAE